MIFITLCLLLGYFLYWITERPPGFPPGPPNLPIVGYLPFLTAEPQKKFMELGKRFGDVISINYGPFRRLVVLNSYSAIRDAFKDEVFSGRPDNFFFSVRSDGNHGVVFSQGADWKEMRRSSLRGLRDFGFGKSVLENAIISEIVELLKNFKGKAGIPVTPHGLFNIAVLNALWTIITGERICLNDPQTNSTLANIRRFIAGRGISGLAFFLPYRKCLPLSLIGLREFADQFSELRRLFQNEVNMQRENFNKDDQIDNLIKTFLQKVDQTTDKSSAFYGDKGMKNIVHLMMDFFAAGSETLSSTLTWLVLLLAKHPEIQDKVHKEMDRVFGKNRFPSLDDKPQLPFTEAVILETLRYGSSIPLGVLHRVMADTEFRDFKLPKGTFVSANLYAVHHDPALWEKPNEFYPQHFLDDQGKLKPSDYLIPFSLGKRMCLGESLAKMELFLFATHLMHTFIFSFPQDEPPPSMATTQSLVRVPLPYKVVMSPR